MNSTEVLHLKIIYFAKFKKFWLNRKLKALKTKVSSSYANHKLAAKAFKVLRDRQIRRREYLRVIQKLKKNQVSLESFVQMPSPLAVPFLKQIFVIHHHRLKTLRKYFNFFLFHHKFLNRK